MIITVVGAGYVGLVSAAVLAKKHTVICVDKDKKKIAALRKGKVPFYEPGLPALLSDVVKRPKGLSFATDLPFALRMADAVFICVGTPSNPDGSANISAVLAVAKEIAVPLKVDGLVVIKSTVPPGTWSKVASTILQTRPQGKFMVVSNPEFLREGSAINDMEHPDRVVVGAEDDAAFEVMARICRYNRVMRTWVEMDNTSAELTKYASNAFLAMKISYANLLAEVCESTGGNVDKVTQAMGLDKRIGGSFLWAGIGYGGSCFGKDVAAFHRIDPGDLLLSSVQGINERARSRVVGVVEAVLHGNAVVAVFGLAFKPNTDDIRDSPALHIAERLVTYGYKVNAYDPAAMENVRKLKIKGLKLCKDTYEAVKGASCLIIATEWREVYLLDFIRIKRLMKQPRIFDGRNMLDPSDMRKLGFIYQSIGRP